MDLDLHFILSRLLIWIRLSMLITGPSGVFDSGNTLPETIHLKLGEGRGDLVGAPAASAC